MKPVKPKICKVCEAEFIPTQIGQKVCGWRCAIILGRETRAEVKAKKQRRETREAKQRLKTRSDHLREAQTAFNAYIRKRDENEPCISCGKTKTTEHLTGSGWDCGHYRSVGSCPEMRFHPLNARKQCVKCNRELSGNHVEYRNRLKAIIGEELLDWVEGPHQPQKWSIDEIKEIRQHYRQLTKELGNGVL